MKEIEISDRLGNIIHEWKVFIANVIFCSILIGNLQSSDESRNHFVSRSGDHQLDARTPPNTLRLTHHLLTDNSMTTTSSSGSESKVCTE